MAALTGVSRVREFLALASPANCDGETLCSFPRSHSQQPKRHLGAYAGLR